MKMKLVLATLFAFTVLFTQAQSAIIIHDNNVSRTEFFETFRNDRVWYAEFQPGGRNTTHPDNEFELGGPNGYDQFAYYQGNTTVVDKADNPFTIDVSESNFLSVTFNGVGTPEGYQYGITESFNTIWVGLAFNAPNGFPNFLGINTHEVDGTVILPDMYLAEQTSEWTGFKFYKDDALEDIGAITISGNINPDMFGGVALDEDWTYTVFATYDPTIIPEPSSSVLLIAGLTLLAFYRRK